MGTFLSMTVAGRLMGKVDTRLLIMTGMVLMAVSLWQMSGFALGMNAQPIAFSGFVQGLGMGLIFIPLNVTAFATIAPYLRTSAASLMTLMRSIGGSVGISMVTSLLARNLQTSHADLASQITPASTPPVDPGLLSMLGGAGTTVTMLLDAEINRQAAMIAYIDDFYLMMLVTFAALPLVLFMKKPRARRSPPPMVAE